MKMGHGHGHFAFCIYINPPTHFHFRFRFLSGDHRRRFSRTPSLGWAFFCCSPPMGDGGFYSVALAIIIVDVDVGHMTIDIEARGIREKEARARARARLGPGPRPSPQPQGQGPAPSKAPAPGPGSRKLQVHHAKPPHLSTVFCRALDLNDCLCCCFTWRTSNCNLCLRHFPAVYKAT